MNLNLGTAALFTALLEIVLAAGMCAFWARGRARYLIYWGFGFFVFGVGALLLTLRGTIPDFLSILVGNLCTTLSSVLLYVGVCIFFERRRSWLPWMVGILSLEVALLAYYSYVTYDTSSRVYVYGAAQLLIALMTLQTLFTMNRGREARFIPEVAAVALVTLAALVAHSARLAGTPFFPVPQDFLSAGTFQVLFAFGIQFIHVGYAISFGNMHASALHEKLRKALANAEAKDRQKVEILGYVSHDLRAPLSTISGYSSLLLANANEDQRKHLLAIQRGVRYQLSLIDELLEYAKAELQPLAIQPVTTDLPLLLDNIAEYGIALCSHQNNGFRYEPSTQIPQRINIDGKRLQQVLLNLLSNAAKFTRDGLVTLSVTAHKEEAIYALKFAVSDTGIGVDLDQDADIFSAFHQVQAASGSTGLGLFIVRHIVEAMGGSLSVTSVYGNGATFSFVLFAPADEADADWAVVEQRETEPVGSSSMPSMPRNFMPEDGALDVLAGLALQGRFTDIEHWVAHHADQVAHAEFIAQLLDLLERLDFRGIHRLALSGRSVSDQRSRHTPT